MTPGGVPPPRPALRASTPSARFPESQVMIHPDAMGEMPHLLLVDDERSIREPLAQYLAKQGFRVTQSADAESARTRLAAYAIDLVILDIMMPGEDGLSLCRHIAATSDTPVILLTAKAEETDRIVGLEMGADDYIVQAVFSPRELVATHRQGRAAPADRRPCRRAMTPPGAERVRLRRLDPGHWPARTLDRYREGASPCPCPPASSACCSALLERPAASRSPATSCSTSPRGATPTAVRSFDRQSRQPPAARRSSPMPKNPRLSSRRCGAAAIPSPPRSPGCDPALA